jgi:hypothetical protein
MSTTEVATSDLNGPSCAQVGIPHCDTAWHPHHGGIRAKAPPNAPLGRLLLIWMVKSEGEEALYISFSRDN